MDIEYDNKDVDLCNYNTNKILNNDLYRNYEYRMSTGVLLLINCPKIINISIDFINYSISVACTGVKLIPYGNHFVSYSCPDYNNVKKGFFMYIDKNNSNVVKSWNSTAKDFIDVDKESNDNFIEGIKNLEFDVMLANFPTINDSKYMQLIQLYYKLSNRIDKNLINKFQPLNNLFISSLDLNENLDSIDAETNNNKTNTSNKKARFNGKPFFTDIYYLLISNKNNKESYLDKSYILDTLITKEYNNNIINLIGELQMSFIVFLIGEVYEGYEQWINICLIFFESFIYSNNKANVKYIEEFLYVILNQFMIFNYSDANRIECRNSIYKESNNTIDFFHDISNNTLIKSIENYINDMRFLNNKDKEYNKVCILIKLLEDFLINKAGVIIRSEEEKIIDKYNNETNQKIYDTNKYKINNTNKIYYYKKQLDEEDDELPVIVDINNNKYY